MVRTVGICNALVLVTACVLNSVVLNSVAWSQAGTSPAEAYANELKQLKSQRDAILREAAVLIQKNEQLFRSAMAAQANAVRLASAAAATADYSVSTREYDPSKRSSSSASSSSSSEKKNKVTETTVSSNAALKVGLAGESDLWALQSQASQAQMQQVNAVFSHVLKQFVLNLNACCRLTDVYGKRSREESQTAIDLTEEWLADAPADAGSLLIRAAALRNLGDIDAAKTTAMNAKQLSTPARPLAMVLISQCLFLEGESEAAREEIAAAIRSAQRTQFEEPYVVAGLMLLANHKPKSVREQLQKALRADDSVEYVQGLLALHDCMQSASRGTPKSARDFFTKLGKQATKVDQPTLELEGQIYWAIGDFDSAIRVTQDILTSAAAVEKPTYEKQLIELSKKVPQHIDWAEYVRNRWIIKR